MVIREWKGLLIDGKRGGDREKLQVPYTVVGFPIQLPTNSAQQGLKKQRPKNHLNWNSVCVSVPIMLVTSRMCAVVVICSYCVRTSHIF